MGDYLKCPRAYYLKNVYRDPKTNHKISLMQPAMALGQVVHDVLDSISDLPAEERFTEPLASRFDQLWLKVSGSLGGFSTPEEESGYRERGLAMIKRVQEHPGPLLKKAIKIRQELPYYWLSEEDEIILCGKIDWLEYDEATDGVRIIDFKTGKFDEDPDSLQLPIYHLLVVNTQKRPVVGAQYWYLDRDDAPVDADLPNLEQARDRVMEIAKRVALARKLERFVCKSKDGCQACRPLESVVAGKGTFIGVDNLRRDMYVL
jgi:ATP-dependent helicase/DNAse subunit B